MRVLYLTNESFLHGPIISSQVVSLLERLVLGGQVDQATLITFDRQDEPVVEQPHSTPRLHHLRRRDRGHLRNMVWAAWYAVRHAAEYDLVHVRSYPAMVAGIAARFLRGKPVIFDPRGLFPEELSYLQGRHAATRVFKALERVFCAAAARTVVVSEPFREYLLNRYRLPTGSVVTIPTFSSVYEAAPGAGVQLRAELGWEGATIFVYSGSMEVWQRLDAVVRFFDLAAARDPSARFLFLSTQRAEFEAYLEPRLPRGRWAVRSADSRALTRMLAQCDFGVIFRDDHIVNRVAAPIKIKDYLLAGLPVVLSNHIGDSSAWVRTHRAGVVVGSLDDAGMGGALASLYAAAPWDRARIADAARQAFDIDRVVQGYAALYRSIVPSRTVTSFAAAPDR